MKRVRPAIPWSVQHQVAVRQAVAVSGVVIFPSVNVHGRNTQADYREATRQMLAIMFPGGEKTHCDHNPPLRTRPYNPRIKDVAARYTPNANDPDHLTHRTRHDHHIKTNIRGDGAQFPDRVLIKRERRREKPKKAKPHKWPKGRKLRSRPTWTPGRPLSANR